MTLSVVFVHVEGEEIDNFVWVLEKLDGMFVRPDAIPHIISTDKGIALMNVVICISNVVQLIVTIPHPQECESQMQNVCASARQSEVVMTAFDSIANASTPDEYQQCLENFEEVSAPFDNFIDYVKYTRFIPQ